MRESSKGLKYKFFVNASNGTYYIRQRVISNGVVTKQSNMPGLKFTDKKEAQKKCDDLDKSWNRLDVTGGDRDESITIEELFKLYVAENREKLSMGDLKQKRTTFNHHVIPVIGDKMIGNITRRDILMYKESLLKTGNASATVFHKFANLSALFTWAIKRGYMEYNPCQLVEWPTRSKTDNSHLEDWGSENMVKLMDWIDENHPRDRAMFEVMTQGVERGVVAGLRIMDVKFTDGVIHASQNILDIVKKEPKWGIVKGRIREVPMDEDQLVILKHHIMQQGKFLKDKYGIIQTKESPLFNRYYLARQETDLMITKEEIEWLDPDWITVTSKRNTASAGLTPVKPHEWRKVVRTVHRELGISVEDTAELLGNTPATVHKYYTPKSSQALKDNAQKVLELKRKKKAEMNVVDLDKKRA